MNNYIATFGMSQEHEGYYVKISTDSYTKAINYMEETYNGKYCMVYDEDEWNRWVKVAVLNGLFVEKQLEEVVIK